MTHIFGKGFTSQSRLWSNIGVQGKNHSFKEVDELIDAESSGD